MKDLVAMETTQSKQTTEEHMTIQVAMITQGWGYYGYEKRGNTLIVTVAMVTEARCLYVCHLGNHDRTKRSDLHGYLLLWQHGETYSTALSASRFGIVTHSSPCSKRNTSPPKTNPTKRVPKQHTAQHRKKI